MTFGIRNGMDLFLPFRFGTEESVMPTYSVHYSNTANGPPIGDARHVTVDTVEEAIRFAEDNFTPPPHQPSVGDIKGYCICDDQKQMVGPLA